MKVFNKIILSTLFCFVILFVNYNSNNYFNLKNSKTVKTSTEINTYNPIPPKNNYAVYSTKLKLMRNYINSILQDKINSNIKSDNIYAYQFQYVLWNNMLYEILDTLNIELNKKELASLNQQQNCWIKYRDETSKSNFKKSKVKLENDLSILINLTNITKYRCYELVYEYMKDNKIILGA